MVRGVALTMGALVTVGMVVQACVLVGVGKFVTVFLNSCTAGGGCVVVAV